MCDYIISYHALCTDNVLYKALINFVINGRHNRIDPLNISFDNEYNTKAYKQFKVELP